MSRLALDVRRQIEGPRSSRPGAAGALGRREQPALDSKRRGAAGQANRRNVHHARDAAAPIPSSRAVDKRIKHFFDVDDLARGREKLVGSVLTCRGRGAGQRKASSRGIRVSNNDALHSAKLFAELAKEPRFADARRELRLSRAIEKGLTNSAPSSGED